MASFFFTWHDIHYFPLNYQNQFITYQLTTSLEAALKLLNILFRLVVTFTRANYSIEYRISADKRRSLEHLF